MSFNNLPAEYKELWEKAPDISLNDLPKYSKWPDRLLGLEKWSRPERTREDIEREFEIETYAPQYEYLTNHPTLTDFHALHSALYTESRSGICSLQGQFKQLPIADIYALDNAVIATYIAKYLPAGALVDIGAGTGRTIISLGEQSDFANLPLFALEKMPSARKIIYEIAKRKKMNICVAECDLTLSPLAHSHGIPKNSIMYTNSVIYTVSRPAHEVVHDILQHKPKFVIHFEPFVSYFDTTTLYGKMCTAYLKMNQYNTSFCSELKAMNGSTIEILLEEAEIFTNNPFFSRSVLVWAPKH
ncbi:hypothetical protein [Desulfovibrio cuneatus]|uniref:hypothetical protein n=1 Tax=Desulfovibrio cuneatus TaxID=159728 RepID=UPI0003FA5402|nr:hypothetical protein [Desulfovibrio cuneatus]